ncbi:Hypp8468 [Branchiostoma lanceolatum]|uniref:Hypp8468 protein n=1 Tax=Branchiostoma lanceolatum TaxID=7740 RepID=A0A8J9Z7R2_BRALA|nr:Hypp8468 [Branchiostoma lanceolatum]
MESLAVEAEDAVRHGNLRELYATIKILSGKHTQSDRPMKDSDGNIIPEMEGQKQRWAPQYFENLLNRPAPRKMADTHQTVSNLDIECGPPSNDPESCEAAEEREGARRR